MADLHFPERRNYAAPAPPAGDAAPKVNPDESRDAGALPKKLASPVKVALITIIALVLISRGLYLYLRFTISGAPAPSGINGAVAREKFPEQFLSHTLTNGTEANLLVFNEGDFTIPADVGAISVDKSILMDKPESSLTISGDNGAGRAASFTVQSFTLKEGKLSINAPRRDPNPSRKSGEQPYSVNYLPGLTTYDSFEQSGGTLTAKGGPGRNTYGIKVEGNFTQVGGESAVNGGSGEKAHGIMLGDPKLGREMEHNEDLYSTKVLFTHSGGKLTATGGSGFEACGIYAEKFIENTGSGVIAAGGEGERAFGLAADNFIQEGGEITATGGFGAGASGMFIRESFTLNAGVITAGAGEGKAANGLLVYRRPRSQEGLTVFADEASSTIHNLLQQVDAAVPAKVVQNGGTLIATGAKNFGLGAGFANTKFIQNGGIIIATGGVGNPGFMLTGSFIQNAGSIIAHGGKSDMGMGIGVAGKVEFKGTLQLNPGSEAPALAYSDTNNKIIFRSGSTLEVGINPALPAGPRQVGFLRFTAGAVEIEPDAKLLPLVYESGILQKGQSLSGNFMIPNEAGVSPNLSDAEAPFFKQIPFSQTLTCTLSASGETRTITITRARTAEEALKDRVNASTLRFLKELSPFYGDTNPENKEKRAILDNLDIIPDITAMAAAAAQAAQAHSTLTDKE